MGALDGLKVIDFGLLVQGPQAAGMLCDMGADVVKIELPGVGDQARWVPLSADDPRAPFYAACNRGKRSVTVDARTDAGRTIVRRLAGWADVMISNFAVGTMDRWGIGYEELSAINPRIVYATGSVLGTRGAGADRKGADLAGQAMGGLMSTIGSADSGPGPVGATIADHIASQNMVAGILAALYARDRTGAGQQVETSLVGGQIYAQASELTAYFMTGRPPGPAGFGHPLVHTFYGVVPTADGQIALVGSAGRGRLALFEAIGRPDLAAVPGYTEHVLDPDAGAQLFEQLAGVFRSRSTADWLNDLQGHRAFEVRDYRAVGADAENRLNGYLIDTDDPKAGATTIVGTPVRLGSTPTEVDPAVPELGEHTTEVLVEVGFSEAEIDHFRDLGAI